MAHESQVNKACLKSNYIIWNMEIILQKQRSRAYNGCNYYRYRVTIPAQIADRMGLVGGERLDVSIAQDGILIRRMER